MAQVRIVTWHTCCAMKPLDKDTQVRLLLSISAFPALRLEVGPWKFPGVTFSDFLLAQLAALH